MKVVMYHMLLIHSSKTDQMGSLWKVLHGTPTTTEDPSGGRNPESAFAILSPGFGSEDGSELNTYAVRSGTDADMDT